MQRSNNEINARALAMLMVDFFFKQLFFSHMSEKKHLLKKGRILSKSCVISWLPIFNSRYLKVRDLFVDKIRLVVFNLDMSHFVFLLK